MKSLNLAQFKIQKQPNPLKQGICNHIEPPRFLRFRYMY